MGKGAALTASRAYAIVTILAVLLGYVVIGTSWFVQSSFQREARAAQVARSASLRSVLNMETGLRGYLSTDDRAFLEPFETNAPLVAARFGALRETVEALGLGRGMLAVVDDEAANARAWLSTVARPLLRAPHGPQARALQYRGKAIFDRIRADDQVITGRLDGASEAADRAGLRFISMVVVVGSIIFVSLALLLVTKNREDRRMRAALDEQRVSYEAEKLVADTLGRAFTQSMLPASTRVALHAVYTPAGESARVGGDWYDAIELPDGRVFVTIGDVTGHGLTAAVAMSRARQALIGSALQSDDPAAILARANDVLCARDELILTALCGVVDPAARSVCFASAGHPAPVIARPGRPPELGPYGGVPLGIRSRQTYDNATVDDLDGAMVVFYTDGLIESKRDAIDGERRLLEACARALPLDGHLAKAIRSTVLADDTVSDDVAILVVRFPPAASAQRVRDGESVTKVP